MTKPKLSFWQIWNLSFGFLGVQIGYSLQNSNTSSIFESLGADVSHLSYFWLAAPLAGMIVQPIVGLFFFFFYRKQENFSQILLDVLQGVVLIEMHMDF